MPPSQLKQLKASLRDTGVLGPQQSKKKKRQDVKSGVGAQNRVQRNAALQAVRDRFNPFEIKTANTRSKFDVTTRDGGSKPAGVQARPGVTKSLGEEKVSWIALSMVECCGLYLEYFFRDVKPCSAIWNQGRKSVVFWIVDLVKMTRP